MMQGSNGASQVRGADKLCAEPALFLCRDLACAEELYRVGVCAGLADGFTLEQVRFALCSPRFLTVGVRYGGVLAGFAQFGWVMDQATLDYLVVQESCRRRGLGRTLLTFGLAELNARGVLEMSLEVRTENRPARALYRDLGFQEVYRRKGYYKDPTEDALVLIKRWGNDE